MPRVDDYKAAFDMAAAKLKEADPAQIAALTGAEYAEGALRLHFVDSPVVITLDPVTVTKPDGAEISLTDAVLILHYLTQADGRPVTGEWIAYREIPGAQTYQPVFYKRAIAPLNAAFGPNPARLNDLTGHLLTRPGESGDASVVVQALPRAPVSLIVWGGDEDFPSEATILFDKSIDGYLTAEDAAWLAGRIVYPLAGMARAQGDKK